MTPELTEIGPELAVPTLKGPLMLPKAPDGTTKPVPEPSAIAVPDV